MRLFVAVLPPEAVIDEMAARAARLRQLPRADALRWTARDHWHLTLAFLGEVDQRLLPELHERLGRAARRHKPHQLCFADGGRFGERALWAAVDGERRALIALADSARAAARRTGIDVDDRPLRPHLTLARNRAVPRHGPPPKVGVSVSLRPFAQALADFQGTPWTVAEMHLVRSNPPEAPGERPRYETLATWPLGR